MKAIDHFTIPLPTLGFIVSIVRIADYLGWHGSVMERSDKGFKSTGEEYGEYIQLSDPTLTLKDACLLLADQAAKSLTRVKNPTLAPESDEFKELEDALRGTLRNAITTRSWT